MEVELDIDQVIEIYKNKVANLMHQIILLEAENAQLKQQHEDQEQEKNKEK